MSSLSDYAEERVAKWVGGIADVPSSTTRYLGLFDSDPTDADAGNEVTTDIRTAGRIAVTFSNPVDGQISNSAQIDWGNSQNDASVTHIGVYDASSGGNLIVHGALSSPKTIETGDQVLFEIGTLIIQVS